MRCENARLLIFISVGLLCFFRVTLGAGCGRGLGLVLFVIVFMTAPAIVMNGFRMPLAGKLVFFSFLDLLFFPFSFCFFVNLSGLAVALDTGFLFELSLFCLGGSGERKENQAGRASSQF